MSTKPSEGAVKAADDYDALKSDLARVTAERTQEYNELREACAKRENALRAELEKVTAERDNWIALYKERNKTAAILEDTSIALRARVAESATPAKHGGSAH